MTYREESEQIIKTLFRPQLHTCCVLCAIITEDIIKLQTLKTYINECVVAEYNALTAVQNAPDDDAIRAIMVTLSPPVPPSS